MFTGTLTKTVLVSHSNNYSQVIVIIPLTKYVDLKFPWSSCHYTELTFRICSLSSFQVFCTKLVPIDNRHDDIMPYVTSLWHLFYKFAPLNPLHLSCPFLKPPPFWQRPFCFLYLCFCFVYFLLLFLDSVYKWNHTIFVFLWLISLDIPSGSICVAADGEISFFRAE